ncbi:MAG: sulfatase [Planctomycetota bacterium]|nr:sulfatase [Planctomycetota bacterium]
MRRVLFLLVVALVVAFSARSCGGSDDPVAFQRLRLVPADGEPVSAAVRRVRTIEPSAEIEPWRIEGSDRVEYGPVPTFEGEGEDVLTIYGVEDKRVFIPGTFDPSEFNRVEVTLIMRARAPVTASFRRAGKEVARSSTVWIPGSNRPHVVSLPVGINRVQGEPYDELVLAFGKEGAEAMIRKVDLVWQDYAAWLPLPGEELELAFVGEEGRQAVGLSNRRPLECRVPVGEGSLTFSFGFPAGLAYPQQRPVLTLTLGDRSFTFGPELDFRRWHFEQIELDGFGSGDLTARFELAVQGPFEGICALGEVALVPEPDRAADPPPTVLLVTSDTHRADHLGAAELGVDVSTPAIDALAERGVLFERGWSSSNVTIPSHAALLTGTHPRDTRIVDNQTSLAREAPTLAERFSEGGYATFAVVSTRHLAHEISGLGQGFDRMHAPIAVARDSKQSVDVLETWLRESEEKPLFVWLHLFDAHGPYTPPPDFARPYLDQLGGNGDPHSNEVQKANYRGEVSFVDHQLARVLAHERMQDAVIAFTADHGESLDAHGILFAHLELYPDTVHVPLVLAWPGAPAGTRVAERARQIDVGRTLLDLAGLGRADFPGRSLLELVGGRARKDPVFAISADGSSAAVTHEGWHMIVHLYEHHVSGKQSRLFGRHETELFHLAEDPGCLIDLATEDADTARRMRGILVAWLSQAEQTGWATQANLDAEILADLEKIGYVMSGRGAPDDWIDPDCDCETCALFE